MVTAAAVSAGQASQSKKLLTTNMRVSHCSLSMQTLGPQSSVGSVFGQWAIWYTGCMNELNSMVQMRLWPEEVAHSNWRRPCYDFSFNFIHAFPTVHIDRMRTWIESLIAMHQIQRMRLVAACIQGGTLSMPFPYHCVLLSFPDKLRHEMVQSYFVEWNIVRCARHGCYMHFFAVGQNHLHIRRLGLLNQWRAWWCHNSVIAIQMAIQIGCCLFIFSCVWQEPFVKWLAEFKRHSLRFRVTPNSSLRRRASQNQNTENMQYYHFR